MEGELESDERYVGEKKGDRKSIAVEGLTTKNQIRNLRKAFHVRRIREFTRLVDLYCFTRRDHPATDDPHPARVRVRGDFPTRQAARYKRGPD